MQWTPNLSSLKQKATKTEFNLKITYLFYIKQVASNCKIRTERIIIKGSHSQFPSVIEGDVSIAGTIRGTRPTSVDDQAHTATSKNRIRALVQIKPIIEGGKGRIKR